MSRSSWRRQAGRRRGGAPGTRRQLGRIDDELKRATPTGPATGFDDLTAHLADAGVTPFAAEPEPVVATDTLSAGWKDVEAALTNAKPTAQLPRGFTKELAALDAEGLEPFDFADLDAGLDAPMAAAAAAAAVAAVAATQPAPPPEPADPDARA